MCGVRICAHVHACACMFVRVSLKGNGVAKEMGTSKQVLARFGEPPHCRRLPSTADGGTISKL